MLVHRSETFLLVDDVPRGQKSSFAARREQMGLLKNLFKKRSTVSTFTPRDIRGQARIAIQCPKCRQESDIYRGDPKCTWIVRREGVGDMIPAECPYCKAGMLVCIKNDVLMNIEPFEDTPESLFSAIEKTVSKVREE